MDDSILKHVRKIAGVHETIDVFDIDLIIHTNSILSVLTQLGVGPVDGFRIIDDTSTWTEFIGTNKLYNMVISYVTIRVKLIFAPPVSTAAIDALRKDADEFEWRIRTTAEEIRIAEEIKNEEATP